MFGKAAPKKCLPRTTKRYQKITRTYRKSGASWLVPTFFLVTFGKSLRYLLQCSLYPTQHFWVRPVKLDRFQGPGRSFRGEKWGQKSKSGRFFLLRCDNRALSGKLSSLKRKNAALFSHFFVIFRLEWHLGGWYFQGKPQILFPKYVLVWPDPRKGQGRQIIGKSVFSGGKAPHFFHRFLSFFRLEWHLGGWKFQGKPEILFRKYVSVWPDPRKCQGRQIIGKSVFFCGTVLPFGRHFLDSNST